MKPDSKFSVNADDESLRVSVSRWLEDLRLDPPSSIQFEIQTRADVSFPHDFRPAFEQPAVEIRSGPPDHTLTVRWKIAPAVSVMAPEESLIRVVAAQSAIDRREEFFNTFLMTVLIVGMRRFGWHHVHAASAQDPRGRGWLVAGDARAGKSTTAALMASQGWQIGSDDTTFVAGGGERVTAWATRQPLALRKGGRLLLKEAASIGTNRRGKHLCWPEDLGGRWASRIDPNILMFSRPAGHETACEPIRPVEALAELVRWSAWVILEPNLAQGHLEVLRQLARQAKAFRVQLGTDLFRDPSLLLKLVP